MAAREVMDYGVMQRLRQRVGQMVEDKAAAEALKPFCRHLCKRPLSSNTFTPPSTSPKCRWWTYRTARGWRR